VRNDRLYVAEADRIEVFEIGNHGGLESLGSTAVDHRMSPHDMLLSPDGTMLYVPQSRPKRVVAYRLDAPGVPGPVRAKPFASCIQGLDSSGYQSVALDGPPGAQQLYVCADGPVSGRIDVFPLDAKGDFVSPTGECAGGASAHALCSSDADCPGGTCVV